MKVRSTGANTVRTVVLTELGKQAYSGFLAADEQSKARYLHGIAECYPRAELALILPPGVKTKPPEGGPVEICTTSERCWKILVTNGPGDVCDMHGAIGVDADKCLGVAAASQRSTPANVANRPGSITFWTPWVAAATTATATTSTATVDVGVIGIGVAVNYVQLLIIV
jgi:hypothetical protein